MYGITAVKVIIGAPVGGDPSLPAPSASGSAMPLTSASQASGYGDRSNIPLAEPKPPKCPTRPGPSVRPATPTPRSRPTRPIRCNNPTAQSRPFQAPTMRAATGRRRPRPMPRAAHTPNTTPTAPEFGDWSNNPQTQRSRNRGYVAPVPVMDPRAVNSSVIPGGATEWRRPGIATDACASCDPG